MAFLHRLEISVVDGSNGKSPCERAHSVAARHFAQGLIKILLPRVGGSQRLRIEPVLAESDVLPGTNKPSEAVFLEGTVGEDEVLRAIDAMFARYGK